MFDYCYKYASWANDFHFSPVEKVSPEPNVTKVTLEINRDMKVVEVGVYFNGNYTKEQAQACADDVALWAINQLSRHTNRYFGDLKFQGGSRIVTDDGGTQTTIDYGNSPIEPLGLSFSFDIGTPEQQAEFIRLALQPDRQPLDDHFGVYRAALVSEDVVTRFMSLYRILMSYDADDYVSKADALIITINKMLGLDLHIAYCKHTKKNETVFTRLRCELTHNRDTPTAETIAEMKKHLYGLMQIVKKCLEGAPAPRRNP